MSSEDLVKEEREKSIEELEEEMKETNESLKEELDNIKKEISLNDIKKEFTNKIKDMKENGNEAEKEYANRVLEKMDFKKTLTPIKENIIRYKKPKNNLSKDINKEYKIAEEKLGKSSGLIFRHINKLKHNLKEYNEDRITNTDIKYFLWEFYKFINRNSLDEYGVFITEAINYIYDLNELNDKELDDYYGNIKEVVTIMTK